VNENVFGARYVRKAWRNCIAMVCCVLLAPSELVRGGESRGAGQSQGAAQSQTPDTTFREAEKLPPDHLDSLVAPIALYSDPMLAASTYPLEIIQLQQCPADTFNEASSNK
jgi:hypothetical protein